MEILHQLKKRRTKQGEIKNPVKLDQDQFNENYKQQVIEYEELLDLVTKKIMDMD